MTSTKARSEAPPARREPITKPLPELPSGGPPHQHATVDRRPYAQSAHGNHQRRNRLRPLPHEYPGVGLPGPQREVLIKRWCPTGCNLLHPEQWKEAMPLLPGDVA